MAQSGQRKCLCCKLFFDPDHRNRERQRYCSQAECRRASKTASQGAWLAQSDNHDYFRGPVHVARVQAWRAAHPGYGRSKRRRVAPLQDGLFAQVDDSIEETAIRGESTDAAALQDLLIAPLEQPLARAGGLDRAFVRGDVTRRHCGHHPAPRTTRARRDQPEAR